MMSHYTSVALCHRLQLIKDISRVLSRVAHLIELTAELLSQSCSGGSLKAEQEGVAQLEHHR